MNDVHELARIANEAGMPLDAARKAGLLPVSDRIARKRFKEAGYKYDRSAKQWIQSNEIAATTEPAPAPATIDLTKDELIALKDFARQLIQGNNNITQYDNSDIELYKRSLAIDKDNRDRKTFVINKNTAQQFDELATRVNLDKSDLLEIALTDFIEKYGDS